MHDNGESVQLVVELHSEQQMVTAVFTSKLSSMNKVTKPLSKGKHTCTLRVGGMPPPPQQIVVETVVQA